MAYHSENNLVHNSHNLSEDSTSLDHISNYTK